MTQGALPILAARPAGDWVAISLERRMRASFLSKGLRRALCPQKLPAEQESASHQVWAVPSARKELACAVDVTALF